jgi:hypothetical protein
VIRRTVIALVSAALAWALVLSNGVAGASVSTTSAATPELGTSGTDGSIETVRQIVQCGTTMYAVGLFSRVEQPNSENALTRNNAFAFRATAPHTITAWNPNVNGRVDTVACGTDSTYVLIGGTFTRVNGTAVRNIAKVNTTTGAAMPFSFQPNNRVAHIEVVTDAGGVRHALVGGYFTGLLDSRNPVTGADDGYGTPAITGTYSGNYTDPDFPAAGHARRIWNMTVSPDGRAVLMSGVFNRVGGDRHEQLFRLNLTAGSATVSDWTPRELFTPCFTRQPYYAQDAAWSPDMTRIYTATTGLRTYAEQLIPAGDRPQQRSGPCDAVISYPATETAFDGHQWINYTGCDSLYSVAADASTVFAGGHQRWVSNGNACDRAGAGSFPASGLSHMSSTTGARQAGATRGRGLGAVDLLRTSAGLWIGSDNQANTASCGGSSQRMGICFLPN